MKKDLFKLKNLVIVTSLCLTACGGGGGGDNNSSGGNGGGNGGGTTPSFTSKAINGVAVDFYLSGSTVSFDDCEDGNGGQLTTVTKEDGSFEFNTTESCQKSALTITGGTDTVTGLPFTGTLKVKATNLQELDSSKNLVASPLTTIAAYVTSEADLQVLLTSLGIKSTNVADLSSFDPVKQGSAEEMANVFVLQQLITQIEDNLQSISDESGTPVFNAADATKLAINALAATVKASPNTPLLAGGAVNVTALNNVLEAAKTETQTAIAQKGVTATVPSLDTISSAVVAVSNGIKEVISAGGNGASLQDALKNNPVLDTIKDQLKVPTIKTFTLANYDLAALKGSNATNPILLNKANLTNLAFVNFALANAKSAKNESAQIAFKLTATRNNVVKTLNVYLGNLNIKFNTNGQTSTVTIPKGTTVEISSTLSEINSLTITTAKELTLAPDANGNISLLDILKDSKTLKNYYDTYFAQLNLGDQLHVTTIVSPRILNIDPSLGLSTSSTKVNNTAIKGSTVQAYFTVN